MEGDEFAQVRRIVLASPGVTERISHGEPCFFVQGKRPLCYFHDNHRGDGHLAVVPRPAWRACRPDGERTRPVLSSDAFGVGRVRHLARPLPRHRW